MNAVDDHFERLIRIAHDKDEAQAVTVCIRIDAEPVDGTAVYAARLAAERFGRVAGRAQVVWRTRRNGLVGERD